MISVLLSPITASSPILHNPPSTSLSPFSPLIPTQPLNRRIPPHHACQPTPRLLRKPQATIGAAYAALHPPQPQPPLFQVDLGRIGAAGPKRWL